MSPESPPPASESVPAQPPPPASLPAVDDGGIRPLLPRREHRAEADLDITPMIDVTFLLLIFFLVASTADMERAVDLPPARYGTAVSARTSTIITLVEGSPGAPAAVYLADGVIGAPRAAGPGQRDVEIMEAVEEGFREGRESVLIKAARGVRHRDVSRVAEAAGRLEGIQLHLAVLETD